MKNKMIKEMEDFLRTAPDNMDTRDMANQLCGYKEGRKETLAEVNKMIDKFDFANRVIIEDINTENNNQMDKRLKKELKQKLQELQNHSHQSDAEIVCSDSKVSRDDPLKRKEKQK